MPASTTSPEQDTLHGRRVALLAVASAVAGTAGCTAAPTHRGEARNEAMSAEDVVQSDTNRMATLGMRDNIESLLRLADKLYRRNPAEWRRAGHTSREAALQDLQSAIRTRTAPASLQGKRDIAALALALGPDFKGDRVNAFTYANANADMLIAAHGDKMSFNLLDGLDAQYIFNAARNIESAMWMLGARRTPAGQPLLLADEINALERNLSFEREFGKIVGRLDLLSEVLTEKYRRAAIGYVQGLVGGQFLQFLPVR